VLIQAKEPAKKELYHVKYLRMIKAEERKRKQDEKRRLRSMSSMIDQGSDATSLGSRGQGHREKVVEFESTSPTPIMENELDKDTQNQSSSGKL